MNNLLKDYLGIVNKKQNDVENKKLGRIGGDNVLKN
jgi:hypothetical protein